MMAFRHSSIKLLMLEIVMIAKQAVSETAPYQDQGVCGEYLVTGQNYGVSNEQLDASSQYNSLHAAKWGRLNTVYVKDEHIGGWAADNTSKISHYIEVRLNQVSTVQAIATQGRNITGDTTTNPQYVTIYHVYYIMESKWIPISDLNNTPKDFQGNNDSNSIHINPLPDAVKTNKVRILLMKWEGYPSMRFDLIGCSASEDCSFKDGICNWKNQNHSRARGDNDGNKDTKTSSVLVGVAFGVGLPCVFVLTTLGIYVSRRRRSKSSAAPTSKQTVNTTALCVQNQPDLELKGMALDTGYEYANVMSGKSEDGKSDTAWPDYTYGIIQETLSTNEKNITNEDCKFVTVPNEKRNFIQKTQKEQVYDLLDTGVKIQTFEDDTYDHVQRYQRMT